MTAPDTRSAQTDAGSLAPDDVQARRIRGGVLLLGALAIVGLITTDILPFYWFPTLTGLTYLAAAAASRSRGTLWAPGFVITSVGLAAALWLRDGRPADFQFLALSVLALGLGGVLASLLAQSREITVSAMSVSLAVLLFGGFALLEQQGIEPVAGNAWFYSVVLGVWGLYELRPARR